MSAFFPAQIAGQIIAFAVVTAFLFWFVLMIGIRHLGVAPTRQRALGAIIAVVLAVWYGIAVWTATLGVYKAEAAFLGIAVLVPIVVGVVLFASRGYRRMVDAIPQYWFAGFHTLRIVFGFAFLAIYELGEAPGVVALSAGYGDIISGALGGIAAYLSFGRKRFAVGALILWNVVGLVDFFSVLPLGLVFIGPSDRIADFFPFYLIPGYVVPMFFMLHVYSIRGLILRRSR